VRLAGEAGEETRIGGADLHVGMRLGEGDPDLVDSAMGEEHRERREPRHEAQRGQAGRDTDHVLFGDPHLEEAIGIRRGESVGPGR
jgi:hypothetical protein